MDKLLRLKIAAMILFWFGIIVEFLVVVNYSLNYYLYDTILGIDTSSFSIPGTHWWYLVYGIFFHFSHLVTGYLLSRGSAIGVLASISLSVYEILAFFLPEIDPIIFTPYGIVIRILFAFVIYLIVSGRKQLVTLKSENWRPWKNPLK